MSVLVFLMCVSLAVVWFALRTRVDEWMESKDRRFNYLWRRR